MWGGAHQRIGHGHQGDVFTDRREVPYLILREPVGLAFLVIDFHRPAMPSDAGEGGGVPGEAIGDEEPGGIRQVLLLVVEDQSEATEAFDPMGVAVAVGGIGVGVGGRGVGVGVGAGCAQAARKMMPLMSTVSSLKFIGSSSAKLNDLKRLPMLLYAGLRRLD